MMSKLLKPLLIIVAIGVLVFAFYYLFMRPAGFVTQTEVVEAYLNELDESKCDEYFIEDTQDICTNLIDLLKDEDVVVTNVTNIGSTVTAVFTVNELEVTFIFEVTGIDPGGLKGILTKNYYYIVTIIE